ncbi:ubiquitin carboxyl-terminal hydrolase isozyme L1 [Bufo bufo]|uniref:ubiquitin carboxyl-terminal hydrolase isozyme L1 n=1 Tax=Bufo bufo TaxID=8384 RepID=UPI001ABE246E|nr:ubiquitin carboxyl-terminal hydrolase isozyme L1 [Bufo bufo]
MALSPIEINPEMLNKLMKKLGVLPSIKFVDVLGFEQDYLKSFSHEACAVLLLFPLTPQHAEFRKKQDDEQKDKDPDAKVYFMKQTLENSCGIVGLIHAAASNKDKLSFDADSALKDFLDKSAAASPEDRAKLLEENEVLRSAHNSIAAEGHCRPNEDGVHFHFIVFTAVNGHLYELDGLTAKPIDHGATSEGALLEDSGKICKQFTERGQGDVRFSSVALVKAA